MLFKWKNFEFQLQLATHGEFELNLIKDNSASKIPSLQNPFQPQKAKVAPSMNFSSFPIFSASFSERVFNFDAPGPKCSKKYAKIHAKKFEFPM